MGRHKVPTKAICDPDKPGDYIVIAASDYDPARHNPYEFPVPPMPTQASTASYTSPPAPMGEQPDQPLQPVQSEYDYAADVEHLQTLTIKEMGPAIGQIDDPSVLVRFLEVETRSTASNLARRRLRMIQQQRSKYTGSAEQRHYLTGDE